MRREANLRISPEELCEIYEEYHNNPAAYPTHAARLGFHGAQARQELYDNIYRWLRSDAGAVAHSEYIQTRYPNVPRHDLRGPQNQINFLRSDHSLIDSIDVFTACQWRHWYINDLERFNYAMSVRFNNAEDIEVVKSTLHACFISNKEGAILYGTYVRNLQREAQSGHASLGLRTSPEVSAYDQVQRNRPGQVRSQEDEERELLIEADPRPVPAQVPPPYGRHVDDETIPPYTEIPMPQARVEAQRGILTRAADFVRRLFRRRRAAVAPLPFVERPMSADENVAPPPYEFAWSEELQRHNEQEQPPVYDVQAVPLTQLVNQSNLNPQHLRAFFEAIGQPQYDLYTNRPIEIHDADYVITNMRENEDGQNVHVLSLHGLDVNDEEKLCEIRAYPDNRFRYLVDGQEHELYDPQGQPDDEFHLEARQHLFQVMNIIATKHNLDLQEIFSRQGNQRSL